MTTTLPPLRFHPLFRRALWGGRRLGTDLHKPIGPENDYAESWEVSDLPGWESLVAGGPYNGISLRQLMLEQRTELLGQHADEIRFPLLAKFLDARSRLSVQVHPQTEGGGASKAELWVVVDALPGSRVAVGLREHVDRREFQAALERSELDQALHHYEVVAGDVIFIPSGVVHALGGGLLVAEIQQPEDVTYRLFDWNRLDADGIPRPLHVGSGLDAIDYQAGRIDPVRPQTLPEPGSPELLIDCDAFIVRRYSQAGSISIPEDDRAHLLMALAGEIVVTAEGGTPLRKGETLILPARRRPTELRLSASSQLLEAVLP